MKKLFLVVAIALLVCGLASPAFAAASITAYAGGTGLNTIKTITTINKDIAAGNTVQETNISTTSYFIPSKCLLLGYMVTVNRSTGLDGRFALEDSTSSTVGDTDTTIFAEGETLAAEPVSVFFPQGIRLANGLTIKQWPGTTVTVYYVQDRP